METQEIQLQAHNCLCGAPGFISIIAIFHLQSLFSFEFQTFAYGINLR